MNPVNVDDIVKQIEYKMRFIFFEYLLCQMDLDGKRYDHQDFYSLQKYFETDNKKLKEILNGSYRDFEQTFEDTTSFDIEGSQHEGTRMIVFEIMDALLRKLKSGYCFFHYTFV